MFADAYKKAASFSRPVIVSVRFFDGTVQSGLGAFIVLNPEGWVATVAHLWESYMAFNKHKAVIVQHRTDVQTIENAANLTAKQKRKKLAKLAANPKWITNHSFWWDSDTAALKDIKALPEADLVVGRLEPFDSKSVSVYPVLKDPTKNLDPGTSLCRLGYPFHDIQATFDEGKNMFNLAPNTLPVPRFPIEGIFTRNVLRGKTKDGKYAIKFIETSSPGLRGQSGGPVFDSKATVWGIQSSTHHLPLGFSPKVKKDGREVEEHQFLNVGMAVHPEVIVGFLSDIGITFNVSDY